MAVSASDIQSASDVTEFLTATLPPILTAMGLPELVPLVGVGAALEKLVASLIAQKQAAFNDTNAIAAVETGALADLTVKFLK